MRPNLEIPLFLALLVVAVPATARAGVGDYSGSYALACVDARLDVHIGLAVTAGGYTESWSESAAIPLDCDGIDEADLDALAADIAGVCGDLGGDADDCAALAGDIAGAVSEFNDDTVGLMPHRADVSVQGVNNWFYNWIGLWPMSVYHSFSEGGESWSYLLNRQGQFATAGVAINGADAVSQLVCADVTLGGVTGAFDGGESLQADFGVDRAYYCLATDGVSYAVAGTFGIAYTGSVDGLRL